MFKVVFSDIALVSALGVCGPALYWRFKRTLRFADSKFSCPPCIYLLTEELKLQEAVAEEHARHMNITFGEAKRVASQYQREAEKCIAATETCEGAREKAEALLIKERKLTTTWEHRAREMGWEGE
ncbi:hypothetical protein GOBAR_AA33443 [Gossypium barbadense]|uniref:DUF1068 domain-containing protein n=1 Tax=Gossypium barbadense TaxID=3634 RepID=A0A2P5W842_GOSBA|nr:hypothetical protein GOBAR_AA33443 [Gossypium barbadense]